MTSTSAVAITTRAAFLPPLYVFVTDTLLSINMRDIGACRALQG